jgi:hypothetical protein
MSMKHLVRTLGLALVAALALSVGGAASATAALPKFVPAGGQTFEATSGPGHLKSSAGTIECKNDAIGKGEGKVTGEQTLTIKEIKYTECTGPFGENCSAPANNPVENEIQTKEVDGTLVYVNAAKTKVGVRFKSVGVEFTNGEIECHGLIAVKTAVTGEVIGEATPLNVSQLTGEVTFAENAAEEQQWHAVEEAGSRIELTAFGNPAQLVSKEVVTFSANTEVKA